MPYENPMKAVSFSPRTRVCMCTVSVRILSVDSDRKLWLARESIDPHNRKLQRGDLPSSMAWCRGSNSIIGTQVVLSPHLSAPFSLGILRSQTGSALVVSRQMWNQYAEQSELSEVQTRKLFVFSSIISFKCALMNLLFPFLDDSSSRSQRFLVTLRH